MSYYTVVAIVHIGWSRALVSRHHEMRAPVLSLGRCGWGMLNLTGIPACLVCHRSTALCCELLPYVSQKEGLSAGLTSACGSVSCIACPSAAAPLFDEQVCSQLFQTHLNLTGPARSSPNVLPNRPCPGCPKCPECSKHLCLAAPPPVVLVADVASSRGIVCNGCHAQTSRLEAV